VGAATAHYGDEERGPVTPDVKDVHSSFDMKAVIFFIRKA
jgi:hypothetical protein